MYRNKLLGTSGFCGRVRRAGEGRGGKGGKGRVSAGWRGSGGRAGRSERAGGDTGGQSGWERGGRVEGAGRRGGAYVGEHLDGVLNIEARIETQEGAHGHQKSLLEAFSGIMNNRAFSTIDGFFNIADTHYQKV
jgi:hypothetical protein